MIGSAAALLGCSGRIGEPSGGAFDPRVQPANPGKPVGSTGGTGASMMIPTAAEGGAGSGASTCGSTCVETVVASSAFPRLSHKQWGLAVKDLLLLQTAPDTSSFTNDPPSPTGFDNSGGELEVSPDLWEDYQGAAEQVAAQLAADSARVAMLVPNGLPSSGDGLAQGFVSDFGAKAFRRPLSDSELSGYVALFKQGTTLVPGASELNAGVQVTIEAMLQSPQFVYRIEGAGQTLPDATVALTDYEIATRLSFMLWDSLPDAALFSAAKASELHTPTQIAMQAERMLKDSRAADKLDDFHAQLLELARYDVMHPAGLPDTIGAAMRQETEHFIHDALVDHDGSLQTLLTASYSFVNSDIAQLYGLSGSFGSDFVRADLDDTQRAGLLTQPGFLTYRSGQTAPILRGVFLNLKFLCADLPPPPVFTPPTMTGITRRQRVDSVTGKGTCGESCHGQYINPAGFPLENFDDVGRFRSLDNGQRVDASSSYTFSDGVQSYNGPIEWSRAVASSRQTHECYVRHWLEFGFGRNYAAGDAPLIRRVAEASRSSQLSVKELLVQLVQSPSFRTRASEAP